MSLNDTIDVEIQFTKQRDCIESVIINGEKIQLTRLSKLRNLYWKIYYALMRFHFRKYKNYPPKLLWDKKYKCWIHTSKPFETAYSTSTPLSCIEEVHDIGLYYPFITDGYDNHAHSFDDAIVAAYDCDETFAIRRGDWQTYYGEQELLFLVGVVEKSAVDRKLPNKKFEMVD